MAAMGTRKHSTRFPQLLPQIIIIILAYISRLATQMSLSTCKCTKVQKKRENVNQLNSLTWQNTRSQVFWNTGRCRAKSHQISKFHFRLMPATAPNLATSLPIQLSKYNSYQLHQIIKLSELTCPETLKPHICKIPSSSAGFLPQFRLRYFLLVRWAIPPITSHS